jgi:hypothetical protein
LTSQQHVQGCPPVLTRQRRPGLPGHRSWKFNTAKAGNASNCTLASSLTTYDQFFGLNATNTTQQNDQALYLNATGTDLK